MDSGEIFISAVVCVVKQDEAAATSKGVEMKLEYIEMNDCKVESIAIEALVPVFSR